MRAVIDTIRCALSPIMPWHWPWAAAVLSRGVGWEPPMMMIAALGVIIPLNIGAGLLGNNQFAVTFNLITTISWLIVASSATAIVAYRCGRNIRRYGLLGFTRPNWWFECGRLSLILSLFATITCPAAWFLPFRDSTIPALFATSMAGATVFVVAASVGYASAFVNGVRSNTRAFQCVHYFYCTLVPVGLLTASALFWPQQVFWPHGLLVASAIAASAILCVCGMLSISSRHRQWETANADAR